MFRPIVDAQPLTFRADSDGIVDDQTGTRWTILGVGRDGPLAGVRLERIEHVDTFWFAWSVFRPDTVVLDR